MTAASWRASLGLEYERRGGATRLARRRHVGPLLVQKSFYPEGEAVCHNFILHPPAGIAGGDRLELDVRLAAGSAVLLTTPGAAKWYAGAGHPASQDGHFDLGEGACLEWLPQETIVFEGAEAGSATRVRLAPGACFCGWEVVCLGRRASGEGFARGVWAGRLEVESAGRPLYLETARVRGGDPLLASPVGWAGRAVAGSLVLAHGGGTGGAASARHEAAFGDELLRACRGLEPAEPRALSGVTRLPGALVARYLGDRAEAARRYFAALWAILRPAYAGRAACPPRIWNT